MNNLVSNDFGVEELTSKETRETNGGGFLCLALGLVAIGTAAVIAWPIIKELWRRNSGRRRRRR